MDDVLSINNLEFDNYLGQMDPDELEIKNMTEQHLCFLLGCTGILPNNMRSPSPECYTTFWMMTTYSDTLH